MASAKLAVCRLCLNTNEILCPIFSSFESVLKAVTLPMKITLCTTIQVSVNDQQPKEICLKCRSFVEKWYLFRLRCIKSNSSFFKNVERIAATTETVSTALLPPAESISQNEEKYLLTGETNIENKALLSWSGIDQEDKDCIDSETKSFLKVQKKKQRPRFHKTCCEIKFFSRNLYKFHVSNKHADELLYACDVCGKQNFISEETLKRHKMLHTGRYGCKVCGRTFTCHASLRLHERDKHENDRPFVCDICGKAFVSELRLNYHQRFHTGEKKYVCEECGIAVVTSSSLAKHKRIHSKIKPHVCHVCEKGFVVKGRLVEHMRTHTGERPFVCDVCSKAFTMLDKLKRHTKTHLNEKPFSCHICGNAYTTNHGLSVHQKMHYVQLQVGCAVAL